MRFRSGQPVRLFAIAVLIGASLPLACGGRKRPEPVDPLQESFGEAKKSLALEWKHNDLVLSYCPAQTCLRFITDGGNGPRPLVDFAFLYFHEIVTDPKPPEPNPEAAAKNFSKLLETHRAKCKEPGIDPQHAEDSVLARCILRALHKQYAIRAEQLRFDTTGSYSSAIDLDKALE